MTASAPSSNSSGPTSHCSKSPPVIWMASPFSCAARSTPCFSCDAWEADFGRGAGLARGSSHGASAIDRAADASCRRPVALSSCSSALLAQISAPSRLDFA
eukprot:5833983-Pyramimonas_sp.AAC.1